MSAVDDFIEILRRITDCPQGTPIEHYVLQLKKKNEQLEDIVREYEQEPTFFWCAKCKDHHYLPRISASCPVCKTIRHFHRLVIAPDNGLVNKPSIQREA